MSFKNSLRDLCYAIRTLGFSLTVVLTLARVDPAIALRRATMRVAGTAKRALFVAAWCLLTLSLGWAQSDADSLPRRGYFGIALGADAAGAVLVTAVTEGSTAARLGIEVGDVIRAIDGTPMRLPADVVSAVAGHRGGETVAVEIERNGNTQRVEGVLQPLPREQMAGADVSYGVVIADGVRLRTITSVPTNAGGRFPAVFLIQGGGCGTIDMPFATSIAQSGLIHAIGSQGFVTMRVDKSGLGDSEGPPCDTIGYQEELAGYRAGLRALKSHPAVDAERVFLVGISLGGVFAPILANETRVAGLSVYGTPVSAPSPYPGRSERFFREFAAVDVPSAWAKVEAPVQVLYGEYDAVATRVDHETIARIVNSAHPGHAERRELEKLDHCWTRQATQEDGRDKCGAGEASNALSDAILAFLRANS